MNDFREAQIDIDDLKDLFLITSFVHRMKILKGVKAHFGNDESAKLETERFEKEKWAQMEQELKELKKDKFEKERLAKEQFDVDELKRENERLKKEKEQKRQRFLYILSLRFFSSDF